MTERSLRVVEAALALMSVRFHERLPLARLAADLGVSSSHLCRIFRSATGVTVHQHLVRLRVAASLRPVVDGVPLTRLAFDLGFASHSHFTAAFRSVHGAPPSAFRSSRVVTSRLLLATERPEHDRCSPREARPDTLFQTGA